MTVLANSSEQILKGNIISPFEFRKILQPIEHLWLILIQLIIFI
jgi:hypothetical protein